jgi:hypothetical protein
MQVFYAGFLCRFSMQVSYAGFLCRFPMQVSYAGFLCRFSMQVFYAGFLCRFSMQVFYVGFYAVAMKVCSCVKVFSQAKLLMLTSVADPKLLSLWPDFARFFANSRIFAKSGRKNTLPVLF